MTIFSFTPVLSNAPPYSFQPTLDGVVYTGLVTWNVYGQRWYITLQDLSGNTIFTKPLVSSLPTSPISITKGYFVSTLSYYASTAQITVMP